MGTETVTLRTGFIGLLAIVLCLASFAQGTMSWAHIPLGGDPPGCSLCHDGGGPHGPETLYPNYQGYQGCINCHSSSESSTTYVLGTGGNSITVPVVVYTGASAPTSYLAGGNFYWIGQGDDAKGHNVGGLGNDTDDFLATAPGGDIAGQMEFCNVCHGPYAPGGPELDCGSCHDRISSCHSCHIYVGHHIDDSGPFVGGPQADTAYRFLYGRPHTQRNFVAGIEDSDWQQTTSSTDHNEFTLMSAFCKSCHTNIHPYQPELSIGHPSKEILPDEGDFAGYVIYNPLVPVERPYSELQGWTGPSTEVRPGTDMVNCLSCHRAHGSPYRKILRWDTVGGCDDSCHTSATQCP